MGANVYKFVDFKHIYKSRGVYIVRLTSFGFSDSSSIRNLIDLDRFVDSRHLDHFNQHPIVNGHLCIAYDLVFGLQSYLSS